MLFLPTKCHPIAVDRLIYRRPPLLHYAYREQCQRSQSLHLFGSSLYVLHVQAISRRYIHLCVSVSPQSERGRFRRGGNLRNRVMTSKLLNVSTPKRSGIYFEKKKKENCFSRRHLPFNPPRFFYNFECPKTVGTCNQTDKRWINTYTQLYIYTRHVSKGNFFLK